MNPTHLQLPRGTGQGRWERLPGGSGVAWVWVLCLSALGHLAFTPVAALVGALAWLVSPAEEALERERLDGFVIELLQEPGDSAPRSPQQSLAPVAPGAGPQVTLEEPGSDVAAVSPQKPATPREAEATRQKKAQKAPARKPTPPRPAPPRKPKSPSRPPVVPKPAAGDSKARKRPVPDPAASPVELSAVRGPARQSNARVNLLLYSERLRGHPLSPRVGRLISALPQWKSFLGQAQLDPIQQVDRLLMVGSSFRRTADVVAVVRHRLGRTGARRAVEGLVQRPPRGRWLQQKPPVALAFADRAERLFVLSGPDTVLVGPTHLRKELVAATPVRFPPGAGEEALVVSVKDPRRTLGRLPIRLPSSLKWLRLGVSLRGDGSADLSLLAEDASAEAAGRHATELAAAFNALTNPSLGSLGALLGVRSLSFLDRLSLHADGPRIRGQLHVKLRQLQRLLGMLEGSLPAAPGRERPLGRAPAPSSRR